MNSTGSRAKVLHGNASNTSTGMTANKLTISKTGKVVSKIKSEQAKVRMKENARMLLRAQAVKEVRQDRDDVADLFKKNSKINQAVKKRYVELLKENNIPIKPIRSKSTTGKNLRKKSKKTTTTKKSGGKKKFFWYK